MKTRSWCLIFIFAASTGASERHTGSSIEGFVTLNTTAYLAGVTIGVDSLATTVHLEGKTNGSGYYLFDEIRPGAYSMWADARGYGCILIPRVAVHYDERVRQDFNFVRGKTYGGCEAAEKNKK